MINLLNRSQAILRSNFQTKLVSNSRFITSLRSPQLTNSHYITFCSDNNKSKKKPNQKQKQQLQSKAYLNSENPETKPDSVKSLPVRNVKVDSEDKSLKLKKYLLYNSSQALIPYHPVQLSFQKGKIDEESLKKRVIFNLMNSSNNEVYRVGLVLADSVNKQMRSNLQKLGQKNEGNNSYFNKYSYQYNDVNMNIDLATREKSFKVKIHQIEHGDNGIYAYCEKYEDEEEDLDHARIKVQLFEIQDQMISIQKNQRKQQNNLFNYLIEQNRYHLYETEFQSEKLDRFIYSIINELNQVKYQISVHKNHNKRVQSILECRSVDSRLNTINKILGEVNSTLQSLSEYENQASIGNHQLNQKEKAAKGIKYLETFYKLDQQPVNTMNFNMNDETIAGFVNKLHLISDVQSREKLQREIEKLQNIDKQQAEYHKTLTYLDEVFSVPWNQYADETWDIQHTKKVLDDNIYGLEKVKERIMEMVAVNKVKRNQKKQEDSSSINNLGYKNKGMVILLYGPPGIGKTSIAKLIAQSLKRNYRLISFGGVSDPHFIKGHRRTYVDSQPGVFIKEMIKSKQMNSVLILDEIDKLSKGGVKGDPYYSLLEILNPEESHNFVDHYLDIKVDFSQVIFILTANSVMDMLEPLKNRLEIVRIPAYIDEEKINIFQKYLLPRVVQEHGLQKDMIKFDDESVRKVIKGWCYYESGVRGLNRSLEKISRKYAVEVVKFLQNQNLLLDNDEQQQQQQSIDLSYSLEKNHHLISPLEFNESSNSLTQYLGPMQFNIDLEKRNQNQFYKPGTANVLYVNDRLFIGSVGKLECIFNYTSQNKEITSTGNLQQVIKESLQIGEFNLKKYMNSEELKEWEEKSVHIHFGDNAVKKDGPSAGTSICLALLALIKGKRMRTNLGMTGELILNGQVLQIGGVQEKLIAAKSVGIDILIVPHSNRSNVIDLPAQLLQGLTVFTVSSFDQIYSMVFEGKYHQTDEFSIIKDGKTLGQESYQAIIKSLFSDQKGERFIEHLIQTQKQTQQTVEG